MRIYYNSLKVCKNIIFRSDKSFFFFYSFNKFLITHIKMSKDSSAKYYQDKKGYKKRLMKDIKVFLKKKKKKSKYMITNNIKIFQKTKSIG